MSARRSLFILTALLVALGPGRARADGDADTRARDRTVERGSLKLADLGQLAVAEDDHSHRDPM